MWTPDDLYTSAFPHPTPSLVMKFSAEICSKPETAFPKEWLETNGLGGYASSSIADCHTRKYHGHLVPSLPELHNKFVTLSKMVFGLLVDGELIELSTNHYPGAIQPKGHEHLISFNNEPSPEWTYQVKGVQVTISLSLLQNKNSVVYKISTDNPSSLKMVARPFLSYRVNHTLHKENQHISPTITEDNGTFTLSPYEGMPKLHLSSNAELGCQPEGHWFRNIEFYRERERGFDHHEDLFCPLVLDYEVISEKPVYLMATHDEDSEQPIEKLWEDEMTLRQQGLMSVIKLSQRKEIQTLLHQGRQFLTRNGRNELSIVAGFPWFVEWGRDTMIALPGLTIGRGQPKLALEVLKAYANHEKNGLIPNYLAIGDGEHSYNSIDASLWFFWAIGELLKKRGYKKAVREQLLPTMANIIRAYMDNNVPQAGLLENGLITAGNPGTQLTWMDANAYGRPATPRNGCPVEINGLFIHALHLYLDLSANPEKDLPGITKLYEQARASFLENFWLPKLGYLTDVVLPQGPDECLRPNQVFALSLSSCPLSQKQKQSALSKVTEKLFTPYGMRTLSPDDYMFRPRYEGNGDERDSAYHQGTVWPWLLGHFIDAHLQSSDKPTETATWLAKELQPLTQDHLPEYGIGSVAEVYDATAPYRPAGCIAQAWSVAELIRGFTLIDQALESE
jgi:predicted glycogen debranching enzyme